MFDIGWSEILVIAVVAIVVVGPKGIAAHAAHVRQDDGAGAPHVNDFKRQFDEALREAEREVDLEDTKKQLQIDRPHGAGRRREEGPRPDHPRRRLPRHAGQARPARPTPAEAGAARRTRRSR